METKSKGVNFYELLTLLFIGLKLTGFIDWSWFLVWLPYIVDLVGSVLALYIDINF
ncbi:hypothetical protein HV819_00270 [Anaerococcus sp. AGMB00486]|uniref:Uncharacterized protein n=1 Tax=Anaerococcus faecalis TaxID=2742993 RepID=A0ABX2N798_9FIRM|nr:MULTISPECIES: hypothetical protein [Anaerococcus]MDY3006011.1 hypothetical protein [Anaerococcus porci]NVF10454.1 hypothetical protein [Anaerococcus faecalis]